MNTVLITGSDHTRRTQYAAWLNSFGYTVYETDSYGEAQNALASGWVPDTLVIDVKLSTPQARTLIDTIRHDLKLDALSIIVISGDEQLAGSGCNALLQRPVEPYALVEAVRCACVVA